MLIPKAGYPANIEILWYLFALFLSGALVFGTAVLFPEYEKHLIRENYFLENTQAAVFFLSAILSGVAAWFATKGKRLVPIVFSVLALFCFLDEISFGKDLIGYERPIVQRVRMDAVHDFVRVGLNFRADYRSHPMYDSAILAAGLLVVALFFWKRRFFVRFLSGPKGFFVGAVLVFFSFSTLLDAKIIRLPKDFFLNPAVLEECAELGAALAFLFLAIFLIREARRSREKRGDAELS